MTEHGMIRPVRATAKVNVSYHEFVSDYGKMVALYLFILGAGAGVCVLALVTLEGPLRPLFAVVGLAIGAGGLGGLLAVVTAHRAYTNHLAMNHTTYQQDDKPPQNGGGRVFIPSMTGNTVNVGAHWLTPELWRQLAATANRDGRLTRDRAAKVLSRRLYRDWSNTLGELVRLELVDADGLITPLGKQSPYSIGGGGNNSHPSTHARRTHGGSTWID